MSAKFIVSFSDQEYSVTLINRENGGSFELVYGDKHTTPEDHANNIYEILATIGSDVELIDRN